MRSFIHNDKYKVENNGLNDGEAQPETFNLKLVTSNLKPVIIKYIALFTIITILLVLPAARSRAAWLGAIAGVAYLAWHKYNLKQLFKWQGYHPDILRGKLFKRVIILRNRTIVAVLALLLVAGSLSLYHYKKDSADGRMLIWTVTANIIKDYPVFGVGQDLFKAHYMDYQADYFRNHPGSKFEMVADDNQYAFNELLNTWTENGILGLLLVGGLVWAVFAFGINHKGLKDYLNHEEHEGDMNNEGHEEIIKSNQHPVSSIQHPVSSVNHPSNLIPIIIGTEIITRAALLSILVFGMFAYPSDILPTKIIAAVCLALLAGNAMPLLETNEECLVPFVKTSLSPSWFKPLRPLWLTVPLIATVATLIMVTPQVKNLQGTYSNWNDAFELYNHGLYTECLEDYEKALPLLQYNGEFMINYGKALSIAKKHKEAIEILEHAKSYQTNSFFCTAMGDSQKALKEYESAEKYYWQASNMAPGKFYPQYLLAKLYDETNQKQKAIAIATSLLKKEIKIESTAIEEIHDEMKKIIERIPGKENTNNGQKGRINHASPQKTAINIGEMDTTVPYYFVKGKDKIISHVYYPDKENRELIKKIPRNYRF